MKIVEGYFEGEVKIPVIKEMCDTGTAYDDYFVWQYTKSNADAPYVSMPSNATRIFGEDYFLTCVQPGWYKFILWGVKP